MEILEKHLRGYLNYHNMEVVDHIWYSPIGQDQIGIVTVFMKYTSETKRYIGSSNKGSLEGDILHILQYGSRFYPEKFQ